MKKIHFLGINGSGMVGVACLSKCNNFEITGCDISKKGNYSSQLDELGIEVQVGQSKDHLEGIEQLVVSAAVFFKDKYKNIEEITDALDKGIEVIRWQQFVDEVLAKDKDLICVSGTHGKTTTTTLISILLEECGADPTSIVGGMNKKWNRNYRKGNGKYFVCESDEYGKNFTYYHPKYIIINNIEMEHPEFFSNLEDYKNNFIDFIRNIKNEGTIIFNGDDDNIKDILQREDKFLKEKNIKLVSYSINDKNAKNLVKIINNGFVLGNDTFILNKLHGEHNIRNATISVLLMKELGFKYEKISKSLINLETPKRRMEIMLQNDKFVVYDDYAHHHTQIYYNLDTLRKKMEKNDKIIAILEPHLISRYRDNYKEYNKYMEIADFSIITKFFKSREEDLDDLNMKNYLQETKINYIEDFDEIVGHIARTIDTTQFSKMYIVIMGAGMSYKLSDKVVKFLEKC